MERFINFVDNFHPALQFTWEISETSVSFLDILVSINGNKLFTSLFYKHTDSHRYLLFSSSHTKRSIPFSQFLRLRRICSEDEDCLARSLEMRHFFVQRGYPTSLLETAFSKASQIPRSDTLTDPVSNVTGNNKIPLVLNYHPFNFKVRDVINKNFHILKNDPETSSTFSDNPLVSFRHNKNIRETLVHSSLAQASTSQKGTFPCLSSICKTCDFVDSTTIVSAPKSEFHIKYHFTCVSSHLIYCISCSRCAMLYIGETGRCLRTRFGEHRRAVIGNDANQPVARRFNNGNHSVSDMVIRALCPISGSNDSRKRHGMRLISKLGTVHPSGINERFPMFNAICSCLSITDIDNIYLFITFILFPLVFCFVLFCSVLFCSVLFVLFCSVLFCSVLFCSVLFCSVLFCSVLFCSVLFCSVLFCSVLFCSVLFCSVLFCSVCSNCLSFLYIFIFFTNYIIFCNAIYIFCLHFVMIKSI